MKGVVIMTKCEKELRDKIKQNIIDEIEDFKEQIEEKNKAIENLRETMTIYQFDVAEMYGRISAMKNILKSINNETEEGL
jgi:peptidoglycan hydrolase CwlO-like protein